MSVRSSTISLDRKITFYSPELRATYLRPRYWGAWLGLAALLMLAPLPLVLTRGIGAALGVAMLWGNRKRRRIASVNVKLCFPDMTEAARARLIRRHFVVHGQSFTDVAHLAWSSRRRLQRMTRWREIESYRELCNRGQRVILLVPHFVGINFSGAMLAHEHRTFCIIKPLRNEVIDWFLHRARTRFGAAVLTRGQGLRPAIHALRQGYAFHYSPDEDLGADHSVFAPFFGIATATLPTLGRIADLCDATVIPCLVRLAPWAKGYEVTLRPPLENFPSGRASDDAARMNRVIEDGIRGMPEQYLWTFKLFKTRPVGEPPPYR